MQEDNQPKRKGRVEPSLEHQPTTSIVDPIARSTDKPTPVPEPNNAEPVHSQPLEGHTTAIPLDGIFAFPDIPPATLEFAPLFKVGTSYALTDWLAKNIKIER